MTLTIAPLEPLQAVTSRLHAAGIGYALGGSGLLYALGLTDKVRDWDLTTSAPVQAVQAALLDLPVQTIVSGDYPFASDYKLLVHETDPQVELIGGFAIHSPAGLCRIPPLLGGAVWNGITLGSPEVWYVAYALMGRRPRAELLLHYMQGGPVPHGRPETLNRLLQEPLPADIRRELLTLPRVPSPH
ncbi:hypothetical protein [Paenibacillus sp. HJGM_3]|uniref:hypothetical protein n=1 Tax=Paenibacillus sp. HJGM_3 TaxID=3379816 RepID=UPI0038583DA2